MLDKMLFFLIHGETEVEIYGDSDENCSRLFPAMSGHILKLRDVIAVVGGDTWGWQWAVLISRTVLLLTLM